ncbi:putative short-chain dehydrogenase [Parachaetomium inaequale]|uniref:Short-chain dehydrogenase n=1 Tax=Parachaetomium inaequale TaxID=2588326 RepID=A0AAN6SV37_9PEZI|nr:putative short-chain dehydrogenase [Parachaetomium inaequale]
MTATSHPEFNAQTEALEVAQAFPEAIRDKTVVVTGVNPSGIGFATAQALASQSPAHLIITGRTLSKLQDSIDALKTAYPNVDYRLLQVDLSSQRSVRAAAAELLSWTDVPTVDMLINSAGVALIPERTLSEDGIELTFATNHVGHFLFTCLIMPRLIKAAEQQKNKNKGATRIVNVSSGSPLFAGMRWSDVNFERHNADLPPEETPNYDMHRRFGIMDAESRAYTPLEAYNQSKVANVLFGIGLTKRLYERYGILSLAVHPGVIRTELGRDAVAETKRAIEGLMEEGVYKYKTLGAGAATSLVAALDPGLGVGPVGEVREGRENYGAFLVDCQVSDAAGPRAVSGDEAERLWELSERLVGEKFKW